MSQGAVTLSSAKLSLLAARARAEAADPAIIGSEPLAIIGLGCRLPGGIASPDDYWDLVRSGLDATGEIPRDRWDADAFHADDPYAPGKMNTRRGGFLADVDRFDPTFFGISPREAIGIDPQQRVLLEVAWEALWDAGCAPGRLAGSSTGVFVAIYNSDYARLSMSEQAAIGPHTCSGISHSMASGRVSYLLDLRGPSVSVDTACSSSLVSVHLACQSLRTGECRMAIAGGVSVKLTPEHHLSLAKLGMLSPDGRCMTFDQRANGFVAGDGCGLIVLKRLGDAIADGDRIRAVIRGTALNQDGRTSVITAPNGRAQQDVVRAALANARVNGADVTYVETHGTGTALGDPIEVDALIGALDAPDARPCALGAVKSNIGHLEAASGIAGLIKAALALEHEEIPPNVHFTALNPHITLEATRFFVPTAVTPWPRGKVIRFAGVSSFGFSGTNAHVVLEEAPLMPGRTAQSASRSASVLTISAHTPEALQAFTERYRRFLDSDAARRRPLADVCAAAALRRDHYPERLAVVGATHDEVRDRLAAALAGGTQLGAARGRASLDAPLVAFVFSGQGSQWASMGTALMSEEPVFRAALEECDALVRQHAGWSLVEALSVEESRSTLNATEYAQVCIIAIEIAIARLLGSWGVRPSVVIGHSAGEVAAAHVAGFLSLADAIRLIVHRGRIMQAATGQGRMAAVSLPATDVMRDIEVWAGRVSVAALNGPQSTVVSGDPEPIEQLTAAWKARGADVRPMPVDYAFHSAQMDRLLPDLERAFGAVQASAGTIPMLSTVTGLEVTARELNAAYWARAVRRPVLLRQAVDAALKRGAEAFVEIGPHAVLSAAVAECCAAADRSIPVLPTLRRGRPERASMLGAVAELFAAGQPLDWEAISGGRAPVIALPAYPFQRARYWLDSQRPSGKTQTDALPAAEPFSLAEIDSPAIRGRAWETVVDLEAAPFLADHRIAGSVVFPLTAYIELAMRAARELALASPVSLTDVIIREPLVLAAEAPARVQVVLDEGRLEVHSRATGAWTCHFSARLTSAPQAADPVCEERSEEAWLPHSADEYYASLGERRLEYGPAFQTIRSLRTSGPTVESEIALGNHDSPHGANWALHPALLDGCLQTVLAAAGGGADTYMPIAVDSFHLFRPAGRSVRCRLSLRPAASDNTETRSADFIVTTPEGDLVASGRGFHIKRVQELDVREDDATRFALEWLPDDAPGGAAPQKGRVLLVVDSRDSGDDLARALTARGIESTICTPGEANDEILARHSRALFMVGVDPAPAVDDPGAAQESGCRIFLELAQRIVRQASPTIQQVWLTTREAHRVLEGDGCPGFPQATMWGLARTLALEHPMVRWMRADLDVSAASRDALADAIGNPPQQDEMAFRTGTRYVPHFQALESGTTPSFRRLVIRQRGSIGNLEYEPLERQTILPGEIEVEVETTGINFRDVLNVLGAYPGDPGPLGLEFCGRVLAVGTDVTTIQPGQRVMGISWGSLSDIVVAPAELVTAVPPQLTPEEAITLPNAFATAYHCLVQVARLRRGERVLIHAGTGGVGFMAVQIAQHLGAEVYATAGSEEKRRFLRDAGVAHVFDSRSLSFAAGIGEATGGLGVDVVLNSLAGDFIGATLNVTATGGRFVEIGKTGIWSEADVAALGRDIAYTVVDLGLFVDEERRRIADYLERLHEWVAADAIRPLPHQVFRFEDARAAFRHIERARHIGKVVLRHGAGRVFSPSGTWIVTGGLGALGLEAAEWLAAQGAERLVLLGRHTPRAEAARRLDTIRQRGVRIDVHRIDLSHADAQEALDRVMVDAHPRVSGILHLAGVLDDGVVEQQSWERFRTVFAPKVDGGWTVHQLAARHRVPQVILFSSIAAVLGSPGQSGYAAANAFLDGLAAYRTARGLPTVSINWGVWSDTGMAARVEAAGRRRTLDLLEPMSAADCLAAVPVILRRGAHQAAVFASSPGADDQPAARRLRQLIGGAPSAAATARPAAPPARFAESLAGLPRTRARKMVVEHLRDETRMVLGLASSHFVDEQQPLMKMGLDSLMALEMRNRLASAFGRPLTATLLFDYPTIGALADFLVPAGEQDTDVPRDAMFDDVAALSDEEAERLLEEEIDARLGAE